MITPNSTVTANTPATTSPPSGPSTTESATALSSDFETFLQMLTAQARYQDPLEPIDSTEYAAQLAQFSMVEQQVQSNDLLRALASQIGGSTMAQLSGWIGMEARTTAAVPFSGTPITVHPTPAPRADQAFLIVRDNAGTEVQRLAIDTSGDPIEWAGVRQDGSAFPDGQYRFEVESIIAGETQPATPAQSYVRITESRIEGNETLLVLSGGTTIAASSVTGLREPPS